MVTALLQLIGLSLVGAFLYIVWPPLALLAAGLLLVAVPEIAARR